MGGESMRELPILFSTEMVRAILDGRKTMTRRIVKPHIVDRFVLDSDGKLLGSYKEGDVDSYPTIDDAPYQPGDKLYVRETWAREGSNEQDEKHPFRDENYNEWYATGEDFEFYGYVYKADTPNAKYPSGYPDDYEGAPTWHPSIHMPKEAARIWLEVTNVRVERLIEITEEDAIKEGVRVGIGGMPYFSCQDAFPALWNSTVNKQDLHLYGWDASPWVWVIEFKRLEVRP
jgi:hypothetical protein